MKMRYFLPPVVILAAALAHAQQPPLADSGTARTDYITPWVHADRTVEFHISAPGATDVQLRFAGKNHPMTKSQDGWWSVTVGPVEPDIYSYNYIVDGANVYSVIDGAGLDNSQVDVPGNPPRYDEVQNVPHGTITLHEYYSEVQGRTRHFRVYLPPQYYSESNRKFPVFYLFNGFDDIQWTTIGKVNVVLDNLIAQKKAVPMIIVMPFNRIHGETVAQVAAVAANAKTPEERAGLASSLDTIAVFEKELPNEIMPIVEKGYRVIADRNHRAIAGLSFGGGTAFGVTMRRLDLFSYLGEFATGTFGGTRNPPSGYIGYGPFNPDNFTSNLYKKLTDPATKLKLFYMSCGELDPRLPFQKAAYEEFKKQGVSPLVFEALPGGHEFKFFRRAMANFAMQIFK
jgi:enterochelin esterase-like enzyme